MQKITPFLWFNGNLEAAIKLYTSTFKNAKATHLYRLPDGRTQTATFQIGEQSFSALDGGPMFSFTPAISFVIDCESMEEINELWSKLSNRGKVMMPLQKYPFSEQFGWTDDQFGVSWQLILSGKPQKITPCLMFVNEQSGKAEAAIREYVSLFKNAAVNQLYYYEHGEQGAQDTLKRAFFALDGVDFVAMDSGMEHAFGFTPAISFFVNCDSQEEVDFFWEKLSEGGNKSRCGWLSDKYGVSWQIVPKELRILMGSPDPVKSKNVLNAMMQMSKIDIKGLQEAYDM